MAMNLKEFQQLKKLMAMTTSDSDYETVSAIRAANKLLAQHSLTWDKVFSRTVTVISELTGQPVDAADDDLEDTFQTALDSTPEGSFRDTLLDIYAKHGRGEPLSPRQRQVVEDAAERAVDRRPAGRFR